MRCSLADGDELMLELQYGARCFYTHCLLPSCRMRLLLLQPTLQREPSMRRA